MLRNFNEFKMSFRIFLSKARNFNMNRQNIVRTCKQNKAKQANDVKDEPIKYSQSEAAKWKAKYSTSGKDYFEMPSIQPLVVVMSLTAFMVYFCILREENDLDDWLREIETNVPIQLEEAQLRMEIEQFKKLKKDTTSQEARLQKIVEMRRKSFANS